MTTPQYPKRLIEIDLPIKEISTHARREKSIRHGHISTLHMWWARRPLAACRAVLCASLWPDPVDENCPQTFREAAAKVLCKFAEAVRTDRQIAGLCAPHWSRWKAIDQAAFRSGDPSAWRNMRAALLDFIADFANWDASTVGPFLDAARELTQASHASLSGTGAEQAPTVLDPFAGGGSVPLEALRIGAESLAADINPVAVLLNRCVLDPGFDRANLAATLRQAAGEVRERVLSRVRDLYPIDPKLGVPLTYIWARTIHCEGPACGVELPLLPSLWLATRSSGGTWFELVHKKGERALRIEVRSGRPAGRIPDGTIKKGTVSCPVCGFTTPMASVRRQLSEVRGGGATARLLAVVHGQEGAGKVYRSPTKADLAAVEAARTLAKSLATQTIDGKLSVLPSELINPVSPGKFGSGIASPTRIGCATFADLHTPRQQVLLATFAEQIRAVPSGPVRRLLALALDRLADYQSSLCRWVPGGEFIGNTFSRQALPIIWSFAEANPFAGASGDWLGAVNWMCLVLEHLAASALRTGQVHQGPAQALPFPDDSADAIITDPPYYGAVMYGDLSDYFFVWLKRALPDSTNGFDAVLVDKRQEIVATPTSRGEDDREKDASFFELEMERALTEARRVVRPDGIAVVVFAHKSTSGWEAILSALLNAGWVATASWPIDTERAGRTNAQGTAALASSVHIVCRPRENPDGSLRTDSVGSWRNVLAELPPRMHEWMPRLAAEGVVGADAIFACLGPALEIFSRYSRVEKASGEAVTLKEYLEQVWAAVAREALSMMFEGADATGLEEDARLTAMWLWTLGAGTKGSAAAPTNGEEDEGDDEDDDESGKSKAPAGLVLEFDAARKIAQGLGAHLEKLIDVVEVKGDKARLLGVAERGKSLFSKHADSPNDTPAKGKKKSTSKKQLGLFAEVEAAEKGGLLGRHGVPTVGETTLDRVHQAMILFGAGRSDALKRFVVEEGVGKDARFWKLAQSLSALYLANSDEKRWVDGVLARKKSLGF